MQVSDSPVVSVVTPFYNANRWLPSVIAVTRRQTLQDYEHLLADDASTDGAAAAVRSLIDGDPRYKILTLPANGGPGAARNLALSVARGRYIAFLDADDVWLPEKLELQVRWMEETGHAFSFHDYRFISHDGKLVGDIVHGPDLLTLRTLHTTRGVGCLSVMIDRQQVKDFRFPELPRRAFHEDFVAWLSVVQAGHLGHRLAHDLGRYRVSNASRSANKMASARAFWQLLRSDEKLQLAQAVAYWLCYAWRAFRLHRRAKPRFKIDGV